ncbi:MAG: extracellular solute-binding protein [Chloroflexi bacterium]|nr:extracellular solute-binding protein [Chloroflexota bacterium]
MNRKRLSLIAAGALALSSITIAFGGAANARAQGTTLQLWHGWQGAYADTITQVFDDFNQTNTDGITVELTNPGDLNNSLQAAIPAGAGPDIIAWADDVIGNNALAGNIVPLSDYGIDMDYLKANYEPAAINGVVYDGKIWGLPEAQEGVSLICNADVIKPEDFPTDPEDFAGLLALATKFHTDNPDKYLIYNQGLDTANANGDAYHVSPIYYGFGAFYVDETGKVGINTPEGLAAAQWLVDAAPVFPTQASQDQGLAALTSGDGACMWTGPWELGDIKKANINYFIQPFGRPFVGIKVEMMTSNAVDRGNADAVVTVLKYFDSAEVQTKLSIANSTIPAATAALANEEVAKNPDVVGFGAQFKLGVPQPNTPYMNALWGPVGQATMAIFTGAQAPADALAAAEQAANDGIAAMNLPTPVPTEAS